MKANYLRRLLAAALHHPELFRPGTIAEPIIEHDEWCAIYRRKACNCHPDITVTVEGVVYTIDSEGACLPRN
jgi:hypothetical protein